MGKYEECKEAMHNTPPERLAKIEYQSHFLQMFGISIVCIFLVMKGFWYIIFAFVFGLGISYSQGMSAYIKYRNILALVKPEAVEDYGNDVSPTRRRAKIIHHVFGSSAKWVSIFMAVVIPLFFINFAVSRVMFTLAYFMMMLVTFVIMYFFIMFWIANNSYQDEISLKKK